MLNFGSSCGSLEIKEFGESGGKGEWIRKRKVGKPRGSELTSGRQWEGGSPGEKGGGSGEK